MSEFNLPWVYRPHEYDDWGWIRDSDTDLAACARGDKGDKSHDQHRTDKTDPYSKYAVLIVTAVNNHERMLTALRRIVSLEEKNVPKYAQQIAKEALLSVDQLRELVK
jgi:hypothetical protein